MTNDQKKPLFHARRLSALRGLLVTAAIAGCSASDTSEPAHASPGSHGSTDAPSVDAATEATTPPLGLDADARPPSDVDAASSTLDGATSPDAAHSDAGPTGRDLSTDRTRFFGASRCATSGLQLCEDFEGGALDTQTWTVVGDAPVIDAAQHARGARALHVTKNGNGLSYIKETKTFPALHNTYFGRAFVYFASLPAAPMTYAHWTMLAASGSGVSGEIRVSGQLQNGANLFGVGTDNRTDADGTGDWTTSDADPAKTPRAVPTGQWLCIEWMHKGDTNETRFFWDATEHTSLHTTPTQSGSTTGKPYILPQLTNVWLGWQEYQTSTEPFELWMDEIAIDPARIGCVL